MPFIKHPDPAAYEGWLMYHSVGLFPGQQAAVEAALSSFAASWYAPSQRRWEEGLAARQRVLAQWGRLINAAPEHVFAAENVTEAFARFVTSLGRRLSGRKVLIAADCFPSLHFLLSHLAGRMGFTLYTVPLDAEQGWVEDEAYLDAWDDSVALAVITWVTSTASKRANLERLVDHARHRGSLVAVDITQGVGVLEFDATALGVDFAAATTLKWLCGAPGAGLAYLSPALLDGDIKPDIVGWFSQPDPFNWDLSQFSLAREARRFDTGTPSLLPFVASEPGLDWRLSGAAGGLRDRNLRLCHALMTVLENKGFRLCSPREDHRRGGSVMAEVPTHLEPGPLPAQLEDAGLFTDVRGRVMRFSPGVLTHDSVIDRLEHALPG
ncbi:aminotransferase class V-fold PLP-dependent enzyme [Cupriavidus basilensis]|uniref:aminotransferase class V-fold PLP-dependent enzyme n=1 Tax=Cupriavidus basilensis TaxID=68895 RepID=UPI000750F1CF|nr:aminotransferase class V-fold PLP-dependent enzyme [Cupriavidus basilensis]